MRSLRLAVVCWLLIAAVGPGVAISAATEGTASGEPIVVSYTFSATDDPDRVQVTVRLTSIPESVSSFQFTPTYDGVRTRSIHGFSQRDGAFVWDGRTARPAITYTAPAAPALAQEGGGDDRGTDGLGTAGAQDWTYVASGKLTFPYSYRYFGSDPGIETRIEASGGAAGSAIVFLGDYTEMTEEYASQRLRLVVPEAATIPDADRRRVFSTLTTARGQLTVDAADPQVNVFVTMAPIRRGGVTFPQRGSGEQDLWVRDDVRINVPSNTWVHEYVHTRQSYELTASMTWFTEASAEYYAALLTLQQGRIQFAAFHDHATTDRHATDRLTDQSTWTEGETQYTKGRRVLAALDARIRAESDGEATLQDVFRRLNHHDGVVSYDAFTTVVNSVAGADLSPWLDRYVRGTAAPSVPNDPFIFTPPDVPDVDHDGLSDATERTLGTSPFHQDTDGDGLTDMAERGAPTSPTLADTDGDGLDDGRELKIGTDPTVADTDGDGLEDGREVALGISPMVRDTDSDGLPDDEELLVGSDPSVFDTDGDGLSDRREVAIGSDPTIRDTDGDGLSDAREIQIGTDPTTRFTDDDRLADDEELSFGSDPTLRDTDDDGLGDGREKRLGLDPTDPDVDNDGIEDGREVAAGTSPETKTSGIVFFFAQLF